MKKRLFVLLALAMTAQLQAQSNEPVRLALISETDGAMSVADVLTVQFSDNPKIQLLERDQIAKVYREQGFSAANTDYLKLGQILGADGLLLLQTATEGTNQFLNVRLVAVKPGVVLVADKYAWPMKDPMGWSAIFAKHLVIFLPKLTVLVKDAIPISIVNLRSAINSGEAAETELQLKLLTIQRLSREPQLFVLETIRELGRMSRQTFIILMRVDPHKPVDTLQLFKAAVESYWQNPGGAPNQPLFNDRIPPGAGFVPNGIPHGATQ